LQRKDTDLNFDPLPYEDKSKDLVFALQVVEHLENPFFIMREAHRVLKEGGLFIFSVPNPYTLATKLRFFFTDNMRRWHLRNDHLLFLTKDVMQKTYGANFEILSVHYQKGLFPFIGRFYKLVGIKPSAKNTKILPRWKAFGDSACYVLRKK
jgi:SAM-dependent methyltransferase